MIKPMQFSATNSTAIVASIALKALRMTLAALTAFGIGAMTTTASAAYLNPDGNFNAQSTGVQIGSPWSPGGGNAGSPAAQSPFTNAFPNNSMGASTPASNGNPYFVGTIAPINSGVGASGNLYLNVDFENLSSNLGNGGAYSLIVTNAADGNQRQATLYVSGTTLYAEGSSGLVNVMSLQPDTWYNAQLNLNLATRMFSGEVTPVTGGGSTAIAPLGFTTAATTIGGIYTDGGTAPFFYSQLSGTAPAHNIDNFVLSDQPIPAVPEPSSVLLMIVGMASLAFYGRRVRRARV